ncbi:4-amino-4-deoxychorismate lyase [Falsibacillus pallidus]|uniref:4-amino-4-deoxychorismate lyase n=2 Tax=Falsibacillus pallidus TaxID=493781 RepID=A0A370G3V9_9BACI|nr:4-amino-4-deoxychorismate lyase [Falsibacillus pallidus]
MYASHNGKIVKKDELRISPFDHGFMYGLGVFETFRTYDGHPFLLDDHLHRLENGLKALNIEWPVRKEAVLREIKNLSDANGLSDSYIRFNVSAGIGDIGLQTEPYSRPEIIIFQKELPTGRPLNEKEGKVLKLRRNTPETDERLKSHHYFNNVAAKRELGPDRNLEGIFLTKEGWLAEGITSNLFWVKDARLFTPFLETGILNGVTREFILTLASKLGIEAEEGLFGCEELLHADEVFFTNSIQEIIPAYKVDGHPFPGKDGQVVKQLYDRYKILSASLWSRADLLK